MSPAARMAGIAPFHVMELMAKAQALEADGRHIIHMEVGEPDFPTPRPIVDAAQRFIGQGHVHYTNALGLPVLREAIAGHYATRHGIDIAPERIAVTAGASGALLLALGMLIDPGDEVLLADPGYPCNRHFVRFVEGSPRPIAVSAADGYQPTAQQVADHWTPATKALMLATPSNPTGSVLDHARLRQLHAVVGGRGGAILVDEIYHGLSYGTACQSAASLGEDVFIVNSFSKYFGMTGWRLGWLVAPRDAMRDIEKLAQNLFIAPPTPAQHAALAAFQPATVEILEERREEFRRRRDVLLPGLRQLGFDIAAEPQGAFYIYARTSSLAQDSHALAMELIEEAGVAATPGLDFGTHMPEQHMRFAYTVAQPLLEEGLQRIERYLRTRRP